MKDWFIRRPVAAWSMVTTFIVVLAATLGLLPGHALIRYKQHLVTRGEILDWSKLVPPQKPEMLQFHQAIFDLAAGLQDKPITFGALDYGGTAVNGLAIPLWRKPEPANNSSWTELGAQLEASRTSLDALRPVIANPPSGSHCDPAHPFGGPGPNGTRIPRRRAAQAFAASCNFHLHQGELPAAIADLDSLIGLARLYDDSAVLMDYMIQVSIAGITCSVTWDALQAPGWTEPQLVALGTRLRELEFASRLPKVIEAERAAILTTVTESAGSRRDLFRGFGFPTGSSGLVWAAYGVIYESMFSEADELRYLQHTQMLLDEVRPAATPINHAAILTVFANAAHRHSTASTVLNHWRFPLTRLFAPNWQRAVTNILTIETRLRMALTAIALKRQTLRTGRLPREPSQFARELLFVPPEDAFGNGPLLYQLVRPDQFTLRSHGGNRIAGDGSKSDILWAAAPEDTTP